MSGADNYSQSTIAQLTQTVLGESMSMDALLRQFMREEIVLTRATPAFGGEPAHPAPVLSASVTVKARSGPPLSEGEIREVLRAVVNADRAEHVVGAVEEFWVPGIHVRADLVVIGEDLHAFEIKSDADSLKRLPRQVSGFSSLFDRCSVVVAPRHLDGAMEQVPQWWGVAVAAGSELEWHRQPRPNPSVEVERVVRLLWRDEVLAMLQGAGIVPDLVGGRAGMWRQALAAFDPATIRDGVRRALASRDAWQEENGRTRFTAVPGPAR